MRFSIFIVLIFWGLQGCNAHSYKTNEKEETSALVVHNDFNAEFRLLADSLRKITSQGSSVLEAAKLFMNTPYVGKTLEVGNDSMPVINLDGLDCLTFVENAVALDKSQGNQDSFIHWISELRYKNGQPKGYASRLHYFSAWMLDNIQKGIVKDVTCDLGGVPIYFHTNFMSTHPQYYPQLKNDSTLIPEIENMETAIQQTSFCYVPKAKVNTIENAIKDGDIFGIVTNIKGLDFAHNGFAIHQNGRLYMLHASSDFKEVMITEEPLFDYLQKMKHMTGIVVLRLVEGN